MKEYILQRKIARVTAMLADRLHVPQSEALVLLYSSRVGRMLHDQSSEMHLMSDGYIVDEYMNRSNQHCE